MTASFNVSDFINNIKFDEQGLVPAIAQDFASGKVLMMAWMNLEAIEKTLASNDVYYWSRSRQELWRKGATSGHTQTLKECFLDCDGDTILLKIEQVGAACHTGERSCFYRKIGL
jgi:phosphoribosyl-AMP cyclohydrolase/phosphoribosyl-ATP pyrophosphohydrolase/phosphoribosyl-AMP cyclohydrolase